MLTKFPLFSKEGLGELLNPSHPPLCQRGGVFRIGKQLVKFPLFSKEGVRGS